MANAFYDLGLAKILDETIDLLTDGIKVALVQAALYTPDLSTDEFLSDIPTPSVTAISNPLSGRTYSSNVFDALDITLDGVTGAQSDYLIIFQDTGVTGTSPLIAFIDVASGQLPVVPNSQDIHVLWNSGAAKIFDTNSEEVGIPKVLRDFAPEVLDRKLALVCPNSTCTCNPNLQAYVAKPTVEYLEAIHFRLENGLLCTN